MRFSILVSAVAIFAATAANAASFGPVQMPKSTLDGVHNSNWDPSSVNRIESLGAKVASLASWYGPGFHGRRTASGAVFDQWSDTAAHRTLPFGTRVRVTNADTGKSTVVVIRDRGPFVPGRVIDLSQGAAARIGMVSSGVAPVRLEVLR